MRSIEEIGLTVLHGSLSFFNVQALNTQTVLIASSHLLRIVPSGQLSRRFELWASFKERAFRRPTLLEKPKFKVGAKEQLRTGAGPSFASLTPPIQRVSQGVWPCCVRLRISHSFSFPRPTYPQ